MNDGAEDGKRRRILHECKVWMFAACLAFGGFLRFWAIDFGLPGADARPDEYFQIVDEAMAMLEGPSLLPRTYTYPSLFKYAVAICYTMYYAIGRLAGRFGSFEDFLFAYGTDPAVFIIIARALSALAGTATIVLIYDLGRRLLDDTAGLVAALILSVSFLHVRDSHFGTTDCAATMLWIAAACAGARALEEGTTRHYATCGAFCGLAAATKYPAGAAIFSLITAHFLLAKSQTGRFLDALRAGRAGKLAIGLGAAMLGFTVGMPGVIAEPYKVFSDIVIEATQHGEAEMYRGKALIGWVWHCGFTLRYGIGIPLLYMGLVGLALSLYRRRYRDLAALAGPAAYCAVMCSGYQTFTRYMVPMTPFMALFAAGAVREALNQASAVYSRLKGGSSQRDGGMIARLPRSVGANLAAALALCAPTIHSSVSFNLLLSRRDTRQVAADVILRSVPAGASIGHVGCIWGAPVLPSAPRVWGRRAAVNPRPLFKVMAERTKERETRGYDLGYWYVDKGLFDKSIDSLLNYQYLIVEDSPLRDFSAPPEGLERILAYYELIWSINPYRAGGGAYDQLDAFYAPLCGFTTVERPGPALKIYTRRHDASRSP